MVRARQHRVAVEASLKGEIKVGDSPGQPKGKEAQGSQATQPLGSRALAEISVGAELKVQSDYLDMRNAPEDAGLPHCGYLVLRRGETVRVLYRGSPQTADVGWLYGEVLRALPPSTVGARGWFPAAALQPSVKPSRGEASAQGTRNSKSATGSHGERAVASTKEEAFPALGSGTARLRHWGAERSATVASVAAVADDDPGSGEPGEATPPRDVPSAIERHQALAAKAAAAAAAASTKGFQESCRICMEPYRSQRCKTQRPCCGVELCAKCDQKSLRSGRCYYCREESGDFPALSASFRVPS